MRKALLSMATMLATAILVSSVSSAAEPSPQAAKQKKLNVLFIGNSFTAGHNLAQVVKAMAEAGDPDLSFDVTTVIYGGRRLVDHWRLGTPNFVKISTLTAEEEQATVKSLEEMIAKDPKDKYAPSALARHRQLSKSLDAQRKKWDLVVLQSWRDDLEGDKSLYVEYAPKYAELIKAQGGRVVLYETTPTTQNSKPLTAPPDPAPVTAKAKDNRGPGQANRRHCRAHVHGGPAMPDGPAGPDAALGQGWPWEPDDGLSHRVYVLCGPVQPQPRGPAHRHGERQPRPRTASQPKTLTAGRSSGPSPPRTVPICNGSPGKASSSSSKSPRPPVIGSRVCSLPPPWTRRGCYRS